MRIFKYALLAAVACAAYAQEPHRFEVASIKVHQGTVANGSLTISGSRINIEGFSGLGLLYLAFGLRSFEMANQESVGHTYYDVHADVGDGRLRTREEFRPMLQALLAERFHFASHKETRDTPVYAMTVDKAGFKRNPSAAGATDDRPHLAVATGANIKLTWTKVTMSALATYLYENDRLDRRVVDKTELAGTYDVTMTYVPPGRLGGAMPTGVDDIDVFTAMRTQLGLRLEPTTAPLEFLVIDHWENPSEN